MHWSGQGTFMSAAPETRQSSSSLFRKLKMRSGYLPCRMPTELAGCCGLGIAVASYTFFAALDGREGGALSRVFRKVQVQRGQSVLRRGLFQAETVHRIGFGLSFGHLIAGLACHARCRKGSPHSGPSGQQLPGHHLQYGKVWGMQGKAPKVIRE